MIDLNRAEVAKALEDDDTFAFVLMTILISTYGEDTFTEDPAVLFKNLEEDFHCKLSEESENRINAAIIAMTTDLPYTNPDVFKATVLAFTEGDIGGITVGEDESIDGSAALWTVAELGLLNDDGDDDAAYELFSPKIHELVRKAIAETAQDLEEVPDDVDTMEEADDTPYFARRIEADLQELGRQLTAIGAADGDVQDLIASKK